MLAHWGAAQALAAIAEFDIDATQLPPFHIATLLEAMDAAGPARLELRDVGSGASVVPPDLVRPADARGLTAYRRYGSSEHPTISRGHAGSDLHLILGYTDPAPDTSARTDDGWVRTGDVGTVVDGVLSITGRENDLIIRGGENIPPSEIEAVLTRHPDVFDAAVVGRPDEQNGERVWAFVITRGAAKPTLDDVRAYFRAEAIARQTRPEGVLVLDDFPSTAAGTVCKPQLLADLLAEGGVR